MSIEIDVLNGDCLVAAGRAADAGGLAAAMWSKKLPWGRVKWAHADLRVLIDAPEDAPQPGLACHVGIYFRTATWDGRKVADRRHRRRVDARGLPGARLCHPGAERRDPDACATTRRCGLPCCSASRTMTPSIRRAAGIRFKGEVYAEQPEGRIRFEAMAPYIFDFTRKPRDGIIDLCGLPW